MSSNEPTLQDACGCCEGMSIQSPAVIDNRPGLSVIVYRIGTHSEFLASLQARLSSADYPALTGLRTRDSDDFSIALLDAYACMADVLTFYQERLANESYLRTAGERRSMSELARLIGYRLRPGVAAEAWLAFTMQEPPDQAESNEPKQASGVPEKIKLDQEQPIKVQSLPGPDEKPQIFETVESVELRPEWNVLTPSRTKRCSTAGQKEMWFSGTDLKLRTGDGLLLIDGDDDNRWRFRVISTVSVHSDTETTQVSWAQELDGETLFNVKAYVLRRSAAVFGNNAPRWDTMPEEYKDLYESGTHGNEWPDFDISHEVNAVDLDSRYSDAVAGQWAVLVGGSHMQPFMVNSVSEVTRSEFALTGKVTRLALDSNPSSSTFTVRDTTVYFVSESLTIVDEPDFTPVANGEVVIGQNVKGLLPGRKLVLSGTTLDGLEASEPLTLLKTETDVHGLYAEYFADEDLVGRNLACTRTDTTVNFANPEYLVYPSYSVDPDAPDEFPVTDIGNDRFSVHWSGKVFAPVSGNYTFHTCSIDGVRLWVDNQLLIDDWNGHTEPSEMSDSISLVADQKYDIRLEYYVGAGMAVIKLKWEYPGQALQIIPQEHLYLPSTTTRLFFTTDMANEYQRDSVKIYANVVRATHGETVNPKKTILGGGDGQQSHQRFELKHAPLTFVGADNEIGAASTLQVSVNDIDWHEADTLYDAGANDRSYLLRMGEDGKGTIQFGDGKRGARLPTGLDNVRATYRTGIGRVGNLKAGQLSQLLSRPLGVKAVSNPLPTEGGVDADSVDDARRNMPLGVCTLGRVVSLRDYEDYARAFTGIAKAQAAVLNTSAGRTVFVTVAGANGEKPASSTCNDLLKALKKHGDPLAQCEVDSYNDARFHLGLRIKCDADYDGEKVLAAVEAALRSSFSFEARDFGQIVSRSEVIAVAQKVEGILGVDLDSFYSDPSEPDKQWLAPPAVRVEGGNVVAAGILLLDDGPFDSLELMS